jgi:hypothetical protein
LKEYMERKDEDIKEIEKGISQADVRQMQELDRMFGTDTSRRKPT